ncbi:MAG: PilZ domain-containing protein [Gammaproteobacteria bacterium]|nr:PilZ domain-containing protein [Gammaproteobacteria bacterium]
MGSDKRQYPRFPTKIETIYFSEDDKAERMYYPGIIINRSKGGVGLRVNYPHRPMERVWLEGMDSTGSPIEAAVCWVKHHEQDSSHYQIGLQFLTSNANIR